MKMMLDGIAENHTAAMLEPYLDAVATDVRPPSRTGLDLIDPGELRGSSPRSTARASRSTSTRSATARSGTP